MTDIDLSYQSGSAVLTVLALDFLKRAKWFPWMTCDTETVNRIVGVAVAIGATIGVSVVSHEGNWHTGGQITIAFPSLVNGVHGVLQVATQYGFQETLHKLMGNHNVAKILLDRLDEMQKTMDQNVVDQKGE